MKKKDQKENKDGNQIKRRESTEPALRANT